MSRAVLDVRLGRGDEIEVDVYAGADGEGASLYIAIGDPLVGRTRFYIWGASAEQLIRFGREITEQAEAVQSQIAASKEAVLA